MLIRHSGVTVIGLKYCQNLNGLLLVNTGTADIASLLPMPRQSRHRICPKVITGSISCRQTSQKAALPVTSSSGLQSRVSCRSLLLEENLATHNFVGGSSPDHG